MRKPLIAGNWKMHKTPRESLAFLDEFIPLVAAHTRDEIALFPSITSLGCVLDATAGTAIQAGAQNMHWLDEGAFTGQTSPAMLVSIGCSHVLLGHSELRLYFGETYDRVNLKLKAAVHHGIIPILCVGEQLNERQAGRTEETLRHQVSIALRDIALTEAQPLVLAYEPIWAIGTGSTAHPEVAAEAHAILRDELDRRCGQPIADATRILYGGSVNPENISDLMHQEEIDGALVGGASLIPSAFTGIIHYA